MLPDHPPRLARPPGPTGRPLTVRVGSQEAEGVYGGLDADGALRLLMPGGGEYPVTAGDVFFSRR